jgi:type I restriction enzyme S subunit
LLDGVRVHKDDVLINITGDSVARVCSVPDYINEARVNQHVAILRSNPSLLSNQFLKYYLLQPQIKSLLLTLSSAGATRKALTKGVLENFKIDLPPLPLQRRIAEILGALDDKIKLNRQMNQTLEQIAQARYKHYFIDDIDPENLPEGWKFKTVKDYGKIVCGKTPSKKVSSYFNGRIPFIKIPDMHNHIFILKTEDSLTEVGADSQKNKYLPEGSICVSCIATVGLVGITTKESQTNQQINAIIPKSVIDKYFLFFTLKDLKKDLIDLGSGGTATLNVNTSLFSDIEIISPAFDIKQKFHYLVEPLFGLMLNNDVEIESLKTIRDTLLPKLLLGELIPADLEPIEQTL